MIKNEDEESQDLTAGFGPRHMAINSELKKAYVAFELQSYVGVYTMEEDNGFLAENYLVELMPEPSPGKLCSFDRQTKKKKLILKLINGFLKVAFFRKYNAFF